MSIYEAILKIFGSEMAAYPGYLMFAGILLSAMVIYSLMNIISAVFKWLGGGF